MHEDGIGMARTLELEMHGLVDEATGVPPGFFAWVDGAPAEGYQRAAGRAAGGHRRSAAAARWRDHDPDRGVRRRILTPLVDELGRDDVRVVPVRNEFFGGNVGVAGLLVGSDLARVLADEPRGHRYLLPDVCLSEGKFLDGSTPADLPRPVEVIPTDGVALRAALGVP